MIEQLIDIHDVNNPKCLLNLQASRAGVWDRAPHDMNRTGDAPIARFIRAVDLGDAEWLA
jgi:hypothetical protein